MNDDNKFGVTIRGVEVAGVTRYMTICDCGATFKPHPKVEAEAIRWAEIHMKVSHGCRNPKNAVIRSAAVKEGEE